MPLSRLCLEVGVWSMSSGSMYLCEMLKTWSCRTLVLPAFYLSSCISTCSLFPFNHFATSFFSFLLISLWHRLRHQGQVWDRHGVSAYTYSRSSKTGDNSEEANGVLGGKGTFDEMPDILAAVNSDGPDNDGFVTKPR